MMMKQQTTPVTKFTNKGKAKKLTAKSVNAYFKKKWKSAATSCSSCSWYIAN